LGNTLDATGGGNSLSSETSWGNPKTTKAMIDAVKKQGFKTVRIPVSWGNHTTGTNFTINADWLKRVKEVVDYCISNDMYVILNIHHDTSTKYYYPSSTYKTQSVKFVKSIWTQVAKYFKDYDQHLIFETLNEPRLVGTSDEWSFDVNYPNDNILDSINVINTLNQTAVDAIRAGGGKTATDVLWFPVTVHQSQAVQQHRSNCRPIRPQTVLSYPYTHIHLIILLLMQTAQGYFPTI
jgi:aryl-phospho-beta-D-glucosidase BglC (GH1 family)